MEYLTTKLYQQPYKPVAALVVYRNPVTYAHDAGAYAEIHRIDASGRMREGQPLTPKGLQRLCGAFTNHKKAHGTGGRIPARLLWVDVANECYVWFNPPGKHYMEFSSNKMTDGDYLMPGVIFKTDGNNLWAWAFKGKCPIDDTPLLHGPFFNNYEDGRMCLGNAKTDRHDTDSFEEVLHHWETLFWGSVNSHPIYWPEHPNKKKRMSLEQAVLSCKDSPFDTDLLVMTKLKLKDLYGD